MYENPIVQDNLKILQVYGYGVVDPAVGYLACGDTGAGKMVEPDVLLDVILQEIAYEKDLAGLKILVTAGPTQEASIRYGILQTILPERWVMLLQKSHQGEALR